MQNQDIVIVDACRTAIGTFGGSLATVSATELGAIAIAALLERTGIDANLVDELKKLSGWVYSSVK